MADTGSSMRFWGRNRLVRALAAFPLGQARQVSPAFPPKASCQKKGVGFSRVGWVFNSLPRDNEFFLRNKRDALHYYSSRAIIYPLLDQVPERDGATTRL